MLEGAPGAVAALVLVGMLWLTRRSLEILDESYLLRLVDQPQATRAAGDVYLFGFVLHPVWTAVGEDVAAFRAVGILTLAVAAAWLCLEGVALLRQHGARVPTGRAVTGCLVSAASSVVVLSFNVMVPAYRSLAQLGIIVVAAGAARALRDQPLVAGALIGVGGWTCFVGKPTSAAVLGALVLVFLLVTRLVGRRLVAATTTALVVAAGATLVLARMTPAEVVAYLRGGARQVEILGDHPNLRVVLGLGDLNLQGLLVFGPLVVLPALLATHLARRAPDRTRTVVDASGLVGVLAGGATAALVASSVMSQYRTGWQVLSIGWVVPAAAVAVLWWRRRSGRAPSTGLQAWSVLLLVVPYAGAVGSNLPFGTVVPLMAVPWVVALTVLVVEQEDDAARVGDSVRGPAFSVSMAVVVSLVAVMAWVVHTNSPTGGDLARDVRWAPVRGGSLQLNPSDAAAATALRQVARRDDISSATPVVDLTGVGAGYALMTGGRPLGRAHLYAYQPTSVAAARYALDRESCSARASAWLLAYRDRQAPLLPAVLVDGVDLSDYDVRLRFDASRDDQPLQFVLLRPRASVAAKLGC